MILLLLLCFLLQLSVAMKRAKNFSKSKSKKHGTSFDDLPSNVITNILLRLPIKAIIICKSVCKGFYFLISDTHFVKLHFQHAPIGFMIRTNDPDRLSRFMHLLEYEPQKFENDGGNRSYFCGNGFIDPECDNSVMLDNKLQLPVHGKVILNTRDETKTKDEHELNIPLGPKNSKFDIVNSCNGFLCLCDRDKDYFVVCNPITSEFVGLPKARISKTSDYWEKSIYSGFGFHPETNQYKV